MMRNIPGYIIHEEIFETRKSIIYRATKDNDDKIVIIKLLKTRYPTISEIARFKQEYDLIKYLDIEGMVKVFDIIQHENQFSIIEEDFRGISLKKYMENNRIELRSFLDIAIKLSETLGNIHQKKIVHKDIKPQNIIINASQEIVKITDFGIANELTHKNEEIYNPDIIEGTLSYMSPEQTGRMNRAVDYRTDLYSLGVTFYEMLTGVLPFRFNDPMEMIHAHIAKEPEPPLVIDSSIPQTISDIILKLMAKGAEERYQNGFGLMLDLVRCREQLKSSGMIKPFPLGEKDISIKYNIPQKLIGREKEVDILLSAFDRVSEGVEKSRMMLVLGYPGIGKSALINEIHKPIVAKRGYFIEGKYDPFRRDVPHSAIIQAFQGLIKQILTESEEKINNWKDKIQKAVGPNGKIITDVFPVVELIISKQPEVPELGTEQSQNRFNLVFKSFVSIFAAREHPLALFLDDLQWADPASMMFIKMIICDPNINFLFLVGAYRDNEVNAVHPFTRTLEDIKKEGVAINTIAVTPLSLTGVNQLTANFLRCTEEHSSRLAEIVFQKTNGNPFFANQFLKTLYDERILKLNPDAGWSWDIDEIGKLQVSDNVVELMAKNITKLSHGTQEIVKVGSCIGNRFDIETMAQIVGKSIDETLNLLNRAIDEGLITREGDIYKFYHDRIQEAAYLLIPDDEKPNMHYRIGNFILKNTKDHELQNKILYIVDQINRAGSLIASSDERYNLSRLNLQAAKKAKASAAYQSALKYLKTGIEFLHPQGSDDETVSEKEKNVCWKQQYDLSLALYSEAAEAAYLCTEFDQMDIYADIVHANARNLFDKMQVYETQLHKFVAQNRPSNAIAVGLAALKTLHIRFPQKPTVIHLLLGLVKTKLTLGGKSMEDIYNFPMMKDQESLLAMRLMNCLGVPVYIGKPELLPLIIFKSVSLYINYGNCSYSPYAYAGFGLILCSIGEIDKGYAFGKLSQRLLDKLDAREQKSRGWFCYYNCIIHWKEHAREIMPGLIEGYKAGLETGDFEFSTYNIACYCKSGYYIGRELSALEREAAQYSIFIGSLKQKSQLNLLNIYHQIMLNLLSDTAEPCVLQGPVYNEEIMLQQHISANDHDALIELRVNKVILYYLFGEYSKSLDVSEYCEKNIDTLIGQISMVVFNFYFSLIYLALCNGAPPNEQRRYLGKALKNQKKMKKWARHAPMNHLHKYQLVNAEIARVKGDDMLAMELYDKAIQGAHDNEYFQEEALVCELAAKFHLSRGKNKIAEYYMAEAYHCYDTWGARAKLKHLKRNYPQLLTLVTSIQKRTFDAGTDTGSGTISTTLDLSTVIKSSLSLSSEINLHKLLETIMKLSIENAGAQKGFLILENEKDNNLYIEAESDRDKGITVLRSIPIEKSTDLSVAIVNYVNKTKEPVVLHDACNEGIFTNDAYVVAHKTKSILCAAITHKGKSAGILYLENNLTTNAFTPERLELLRILSSQAAISIENARLIVHRENAARLQMEMKIAEHIQTSLLPKAPAIPGYEITTYMKTADDVGGDYYDVIHAGDRDWIVIGDVSGHGIPAGLVMMMAQTSIQTILKQHPDILPSELLMSINSVIRENIIKLGEDKYMTMTVFASHQNGRFDFSGAHQDIMIYRAHERAVEVISPEGMWIGVLDDMRGMLKDDTLSLDAGDTMLIYTDGITEAWEKDGIKDKRTTKEQMFGQDKLEEAFAKLGDRHTEEIKNGILELLEDYNCKDDVTMVIVKRS